MVSERESFEELVLAQHARVYRCVRRVLRSDADAADVTQQVFLSVWRARGQGLPAEGKLCWLATRAALNALRGARRRRRHEEEAAMMTSSAGRDALPIDEIDAIRRCVDTLDDRERATIGLRFDEGLTLAAIAELSGCAESTVHARLQRALERLRGKLRAIGFAGAGIELEARLPHARATIAVPPDIEAKLLTIPTTAGGFTGLAGLAAIKPAAVAVFAGLATVALVAVGMAGPQDPSPAPLAVAAAAEPSDRPQDPERASPISRVRIREVAADLVVPPVAEIDAATPPARVEGLVTAEDGRPLAGARVTALCPERSRKARPFVVETITDAAGHYALELPAPSDRAQLHRLRVELADWTGAFASPDRLLRSGDLQRSVDATMRRWATDRPGVWSTEVLVTDPAGRAVADAVIVVSRRQQDAEGSERLTEEARGRSDAQGRVQLSGDHLGEKLVRSFTFGRPYAPAETALLIDRGDPPPIELRLGEDRPLELRAVDARTAEPVAGLALQAERDGRVFAAGSTAADGTLLLRGLDDGRLCLRGGGGTWSRFEVDGVMAAAGPLTLPVKRSDDVEPIGLFVGELHGRVIDAATGGPLVVTDGAISLRQLAADSDLSPASILAEAITPGSFQTAFGAMPPPPSARFHRSPPAPGQWLLLLRTPGYAPAVAGPFDLPPGRLVSGIELRAERGTDLEVRVTDASGRPLAACEVWLSAPTEAADRARAARAARLAAGGRDASLLQRGSLTDADGRVRFAHVPSGVDLRVHAVDRRGRHAASGVLRVAAETRSATAAITLR